jgi:hypothetical protein
MKLFPITDKQGNKTNGDGGNATKLHYLDSQTKLKAITEKTLVFKCIY